MRQSIKISLLAGILLLQIGVASAQIKNAIPADGKVVKWEVLGGKDNEFLLHLPQGFKTVGDGNFTTGKSGSRVDRKLTVYRYINGVFLTMEYYEGAAKSIQEDLEKREKSAAAKSGTINGFEFKQFAGNAGNYFTKTQYFKIKNRLYVIKGMAKIAAHPIVEGFFNSVKLIEDKKVVSPNIPADAASFSLPDIVEQETVKVGDDAAAIEAKQADRQVIVLYSPRPKYPRGQSGGGEGKIRLKVLYSASGTVTKVEILDSPSRALTDAAVGAAKRAVFLPAEKDGKFVSVYQTREYTFEVR